MLAFFALLATATASVKDCGAGKTAFTVNAVSLTPTTPVPGENVLLHLEYTVPSKMLVNDGLATYSTTYNFVPFAPTTEPLCSNVPCPLSTGFYKNDTTTAWPTGLSGTIVSRMAWTDGLNAPLLCIEISGKV